jgi:hypothetical protein
METCRSGRMLWDCTIGRAAAIRSTARTWGRAAPRALREGGGPSAREDNAIAATSPCRLPHRFELAAGGAAPPGAWCGDCGG